MRTPPPIPFMLLLAGTSLFAADPDCYRIALPNLTASGPRIATGTAEHWCFWTEGGQTLVFKADGTPRAELAALLSYGRQGEITEIVHGSLLHGETTIHRSHLTAIDPLPVPLTVERLLAAGGASSQDPLSPGRYAAARALRHILAASPARPFELRIEEGTVDVTLDEAHQPFAGYWWPQVGLPIAAGGHSPLGKYDAIAARWTGTDPDSRGWEKQNHGGTERWAGHCNGWAASSILYPDITKMLWDGATRLTLLPSDIKGMLAEASFCVETAFYGHRYNGQPGDDLRDIYPALFHQVLVYYLNELKKPIAFDHEADVPVDNNVISGYRMTTERIGRDRYEVTVQLYSHDYEHFRNEQIGPASLKPYVYRYTLDVDENGTPIGGEWLSDNPDFLWAPVAQAACAGENPRVDAALVEKIMTTLPEAKRKSMAVFFKIDRRLRPHEAVVVPLPPQPGTGFQVRLQRNNFGRPVKMVALGAPLYPTEESRVPGTEDYQTTLQEELDGSTHAEIYFPLSDLRALQIINDSDRPTRGDHLEIEQVEFWAGE